MLQNNRRIKMAVRLMTTLVSKNVLNRDYENDSKLFKVYDSIDTLDSLVNVVTAGKVDNKVKMAMVDGKEGVLYPKPESILNVIDFKLLDNGINYKYPIFKEDLVVNFANRVYGEVSFYRDTVVADMKSLRNGINEMISETNNVDYTEFFNIKMVDNKSIYSEFMEKGYFFDRIEKDIKIDYNSPIGIVIDDVENLLKSIKDPELSIIADNALNEKIDKDDLIKELNYLTLNSIREMYELKIGDVDTIFWLTVLLENYLRKENNINTTTNSIIVKVLNTLKGQLKFILNNIEKATNDRIVVLGATKDSENNVDIIAIRKNLIDLSKEEDNFNLNVIYGIYSELFFSKAENGNMSRYSIEKILNNKQELYDNFDSGMKLYNMKSKNSSIDKIRSMYILLFNEVTEKYLNYSNYKTRVELNDAIVNYIRVTNLGELLDTYNMVENVMKKFLTTKSNFTIFEEAMDTAMKVMGDDIDVSEASVYATIELISEYFVAQLSVR